MNIAKGLKVKNRMARDRKVSTNEFAVSFGGTYGDKGTLDARYGSVGTSLANAVREQETSAQFGLDELNEQAAEISKHKAKIAVANAGIWEKLFLLGEKRGILASIEAIAASDQAFETKREVTRGETQPEPYILVNKITKETKKAMTVKLTEEIDALQDEIDDFNATTTI